MRVEPAMSRLHLQAITCLASLTAWLALCAPALAIESLSVDAVLQKYVNRYAIPLRMIVAVETREGCRLELRRDFARSAGADEARAQERLLEEVHSSGIARDILRYNSGRTRAARELFRVDEDERACRLIEYRPAVARFRPPQAPLNRKLTVRYNSEALAPALEIEIARQHQPAIRITVVQGRADPDAPAPKLDLAAPASARLEGNGKDLVLLWHGKPLVDWGMQRRPMLYNARLDTALLHLSFRSKSAVEQDVKRLGSGGRLAFPEGAVLTVLERDRQGLPVDRAQISWRRAASSDVLYAQDESGRQFWPRNPTNFELQIVRSITGLGSKAPKDVVLSLHRNLALELQSILHMAACEQRAPAASRMGCQRFRDPGLKPEIERRAYGSVVIMDALSGEYLGAAGIPVIELPPAQAGDPLWPVDGAAEFLRPRDIGSVAKAPLTFALLATAPVLSTLRIGPYTGGKGAIDSILGVPFGPSKLSDQSPASCGPLVSLDCYIRKSLNRYAATLIALGAVPRLGPDPAGVSAGNGNPLGDDRFMVEIGGRPRWIEHTPLGFLWASPPPGGSELTALPWATFAASAFGIDVVHVSGDGLDRANASTETWQAIDPGNPLAARAFAAVSPERVNLRLNEASDFRNKYLVLILGGGDSRWPTAKLAEVFSRTVQLRQVRGTWLRRNHSQGLPSFPELLPPSGEAALQPLLKGLSEVLGAEGTGRAYARRVSDLTQHAQGMGYRLRFWAKSGTPDVDEPAEAEQHPIDRAFEAGLLSYRPRNDSGWTVQWKRRDKLANIDDALSADLRQGRIPRAELQPLSMADVDRLVRLNRLSPLEQRGVCAEQGAALRCRWPTAERRRTEHKGKSYAVYADVRKGDSERPCHAVSMAVSFYEEQGEAFTTMMHRLLAVDGPMAKALRLDTDGSGPCR